MKNLLLNGLFFIWILITTKLLWASEKSEFQVIPESRRSYKEKIKTTDNLPREVEIERFVASRIELNKETFVSLIVSWDSVTGLSFWESISYADGRRPTPSDLQGKLFDMGEYLVNKNIYISNIGIASWKMHDNGDLTIRGFSNRFKTLDDARNFILSKLSKMTIEEINQFNYINISLWKHMPHAFFLGNRICNICRFHAKLINVRVAGDKWLVSISGGYQTDAELESDSFFNTTKICIHPANGQGK